MGNCGGSKRPDKKQGNKPNSDQQNVNNNLESFIASEEDIRPQVYNQQKVGNLKIKFGYSDVKGFVESYIMLFRYLKQGFEEKYIQNESLWRDVISKKENFVLPALPYVVDDKAKITGDDAVITFLCLKNKRGDLLGNSGENQVKVRMLNGVLRDLKQDVLDMLLKIDDKVEYDKMYKKYVEPRLQYFEKYLNNDGKKFLLGDITISDFKLFEMVTALFHYQIDVFNKFPLLNEYQQNFEEKFEKKLQEVEEFKQNNQQKSAVTNIDFSKKMGQQNQVDNQECIQVGGDDVQVEIEAEGNNN